MKLINILSNELPDIDASIKECINLGQWLLFKSTAHSKTYNADFFYLKAGAAIFRLDESGKLIAEEDEHQNISIDELFYFSDLPQPKSLSNIANKMAH